jgi:hypothetical protein
VTITNVKSIKYNRKDKIKGEKEIYVTIESKRTKEKDNKGKL